MNEEITKLKMQVEMRAESLADAKAELLPPVAECSHQAKLIEAQGELIAALESELAGSPVQAASTSTAQPKATPKATTTASAQAGSRDAVMARRDELCQQYDAINPDDTKARAAFREKYAKELGLL